MRNPNRIKPFLQEFEKLWSNENFTDLRFGQLIEILYRRSNHIELFSLEDDKLLEIIKKGL